MDPDVGRDNQSTRPPSATEWSTMTPTKTYSNIDDCLDKNGEGIIIDCDHSNDVVELCKQSHFISHGPLPVIIRCTEFQLETAEDKTQCVVIRQNSHT